MPAVPHRVKDLFTAALEIGDDRARQLFLDQKCGGDSELRRRVEELLFAHFQYHSALDRPLLPVTTCLAQDSPGAECAPVLQDTPLVVGKDSVVACDPTPTDFPFGRSAAGPMSADHSSGSQISEREIFFAPEEAGDLGQLGHYRIRQRIAKGGMGMVFRAIDTELGREVAVKIIRRESQGDEKASERFEREARATAKIKHDHVVPIHRFGRIGDVRFLEMPLLTGESLEDRLRREPPLPLAEILKIGRELAEGLKAAHAAGLIHRDIKPSNIFLSQECGGWRVRLLDLGLAREFGPAGRLTEDGTMLGTPAYMSPEQARAGHLDARSDLFSFGVVLYQMLAGANPFADKSVTATLLKIASFEPPPLAQIRADAPDELSQLVQRLLAKKPADRPATANEIAETLSRLLLHTLPAPEMPPDTAPTIRETSPLTSTARGRSLRWLTAGLLAASIVVAVALAMWRVLPRDTGQAALTTTPPVDHGAPTAQSPAVPEKVPLNLQLTIQAVKATSGKLMSLEATNILPLRAGDAVRIEARTARPAYFYVLNLDAEGKVWPMYPWCNDRWDDLPDRTPREFLSIPDDPNKDASRLQPGPSGIESVLVLARETPLTAVECEQLRELLRAWPKDQGKFDPLRAAVSIGEDEFRFADPRDDEVRGHIKADDAIVSSDPVLRLRRLLQGDVHSLGVASCGVCYTFQGD